MKRITFLVLTMMLLLPLLAFGCQGESGNGADNVTIQLSCDDFASQNHITKSVTVAKSGSLTVSLCANPSTGYQWEENATISMIAGGGIIVRQTSHDYAAGQASSEEMIVGAPGKDTWVFDAQNKGQATIAFTYGRPWEGGEKDVWTLTVNVTVE
jgi:predicted secreted protein